MPKSANRFHSHKLPAEQAMPVYLSAKARVDQPMFLSNSTSRANASAKSLKASAGSMIVSRRPPTSSVIFRNLPLLFSLRSRKNIFLSMVIFSEANGSEVVLSPGFSFNRVVQQLQLSYSQISNRIV